MENLAKDSARVYILLLNWNGWKDTIECLESVFRNNYLNYRVVICDNDSQDNSLAHIKSWADQHNGTAASDNGIVGELATPPDWKPIPYAEYDRVTAEKGGDLEVEPPLVLIQTGRNLGFAGGNNVGLRYALTRGDATYVWLLNNDTVIQQDSLTWMVEKFKKTPGLGICGSTLLYYHNPSLVQALGGATYNRWFGIPKHIGSMRLARNPIDEKAVERKMAYVVGASMLVSTRFLRDIGLMNELYFLYYEEIDWATRSKGKFSLGYASRSVVLHKEGASIGSKLSQSQEARYRSEYFLVRNRIAFTSRFFPKAIPTVYLGFLITLIVRLLRGQWERAALLLKILFSKFEDKQLDRN